MSKVEAPAVERIIANTINETARGDPHALAARIVVALAEAGFRIVSASGRDDTALGHQRAKERQLYRSPNGDTWFLARDPATGSAFVRHQANAPSGGQVTDIELGAFLSGPGSPEHERSSGVLGIPCRSAISLCRKSRIKKDEDRRTRPSCSRLRTDKGLRIGTEA
jgi:hypothetical protein